MESNNLRSMADRPFELLLALESSIRDRAAGARESWVGLAFRAGEHWLISPRSEVREVVTPPDATPVPGSRPWLLGVANLRGSVMTLVDLPACLGNEASTIRRASRVLVCPGDDGPTGFLVNEVAGYRRFSPVDQCHEMLPELPEPIRSLSLGVFKREAERWPVLSLTRVLEAPAFQDAGR